MLSHRRLIAQLLDQPSTGGMRVGHGLLRGKGLGGNDEQSAFWVAFSQYMADVRTIHIGNEMHP